MNLWHQFLDSLDSGGGHIVIFVSLLLAGLWMGSMELTALATGALFRATNNAPSNQARKNGQGAA